MKRFADLAEQDILALAISNEEEDDRIYRAFAQGLRERYPASAKVFDEMADEEVRHRSMLFDLVRKQHSLNRFGDHRKYQQDSARLVKHISIGQLADKRRFTCRYGNAS